MAKRIAITNLNARTIDILNTIRANATYEYQSAIPVVQTEHDIPKVGEVLFGYPALANQFLNALINRIALVRVKSAVFNNAYAELKKGYLEFGETVEEVFVNIAKAREFSAEKAAGREFKRTLPDVRTAFHTMNWRVQYPITIQNEDLRMAFTSFNGVEDLIGRIVDAVYTAAEYDEYLLFKYLLIKAVSHGKIYPVSFDASNMKNAAKKFRGYSNQLTFMKSDYNAEHVTTTTPKDEQYIFMDALYNADYDVDVLASAFNMDKATFSGKLKLIDDFTTFDNERFDIIRANSDMIEPVTDDELALMKDVKAILLDGEWFQVYDNANQFTEQYVANGMYWNYFYNVWKTVSYSPFSNAIVFVSDNADIITPDTFTVEVTDKSTSDTANILTLAPQTDNVTLESRNYEFIQTLGCTESLIAVHKYGAIIFPAPLATGKNISFKIGNVIYTSNTIMNGTEKVGDTITFTRNDFIANTLNSLSIVGVTMSPAFNSDTINYTGTTTNSNGVLSYTATDEDAAILVKMNGTIAATDNLTFATGENTLTIDVTGYVEGKQSTRTYTVVITKN